MQNHFSPTGVFRSSSTAGGHGVSPLARHDAARRRGGGLGPVTRSSRLFINKTDLNMASFVFNYIFYYIWDVMKPTVYTPCDEAPLRGVKVGGGGAQTMNCLRAAELTSSATPTYLLP